MDARIAQSPIKIHLYRSEKKAYSWEIHVSGDSINEILSVIREANHKLKSEYNGGA